MGALGGIARRRRARYCRKQNMYNQKMQKYQEQWYNNARLAQEEKQTKLLMNIWANMSGKSVAEIEQELNNQGVQRTTVPQTQTQTQTVTPTTGTTTTGTTTTTTQTQTQNNPSGLDLIM